MPRHSNKNLSKVGYHGSRGLGGSNQALLIRGEFKPFYASKNLQPSGIFPSQYSFANVGVPTCNCKMRPTTNRYNSR